MRAGVSIVLSATNGAISRMTIGTFKGSRGIELRPSRAMRTFKLDLTERFGWFYVPTWVIWLIVILLPLCALYGFQKAIVLLISHYMPQSVEHVQVLN